MIYLIARDTSEPFHAGQITPICYVEDHGRALDLVARANAALRIWHKVAHMSAGTRAALRNLRAIDPGFDPAPHSGTECYLAIPVRAWGAQ